MYFFSNSPCKGSGSQTDQRTDHRACRQRGRSWLRKLTVKCCVFRGPGSVSFSRFSRRRDRSRPRERQRTRLTKVVFPVPPSPTVCAAGRERASERGQVERAQAVVTAPHDERAQRRWRVESIAGGRKDSRTVRIQAQAGWAGEARDQMSVSRKLLLLRLARDLAPTSRSSGTDDAPRTSLKVGIDSAAGAAILRIEGGVKREDLVDLGSLADQRPTLHEPPLRSSRPLAFLASGDVRQGSYAMR